jgi:hypothetical protein
LATRSPAAPEQAAAVFMNSRRVFALMRISPWNGWRWTDPSFGNLWETTQNALASS